MFITNAICDNICPCHDGYGWSSSLNGATHHWTHISQFGFSTFILVSYTITRREIIDQLLNMWVILTLLVLEFSVLRPEPELKVPGHSSKEIYVFGYADLKISISIKIIKLFHWNTNFSQVVLFTKQMYNCNSEQSYTKYLCREWWFCLCV